MDKNDLYFTMEVMIDVEKYETDDPEIAIRCRHRRTNDVLYLWSYEKFKQRLELMAEWYSDIMDDGEINREHPIDPWSDVSDSDLKRKKEEQGAATEDQIKKIKIIIENLKNDYKAAEGEKDAYLKKLEEEHKMSPDEYKGLDEYIESEIMGREVTTDLEWVKALKEKGDEFKMDAFTFHQKSVVMMTIEGDLTDAKK